MDEIIIDDTLREDNEYQVEDNAITENEPMLEENREEVQLLRDNSVSDNSVNDSVSENNINEQILEEIRGLRSDVQNIEFSAIPVSVSYDVLSSNTVSGSIVSENIINKPINEYSITEQLIVLELAIGLLIGVIYIIRRCVFKWK